MSDAGLPGIQPFIVDGTAAQSRMAPSGAARLLAVACCQNYSCGSQVHRVPVPSGAGVPAGPALPGNLGHRRSARHARRDGRVTHQQAQHRTIEQRAFFRFAIASSACPGRALTYHGFTRARLALRCSDSAVRPGILRIISRSARSPSLLPWVGSFFRIAYPSQKKISSDPGSSLHNTYAGNEIVVLPRRCGDTPR